MRIEQMVFSIRAPQITGADLEAVEKRIGVALPDDYRGFLLLHNGGWSEPYETLDGSLSLQLWYSICGDGPERPLMSLGYANEAPRNGDWADYIKIASDIASNSIVMRVTGSDMGKIGLYDWQCSDPIGTTKLAYSSFTDLVTQLRHVVDPCAIMRYAGYQLSHGLKRKGRVQVNIPTAYVRGMTPDEHKAIECRRAWETSRYLRRATAAGLMRLGDYTWYMMALAHYDKKITYYLVPKKVRNARYSGAVHISDAQEVRRLAEKGFIKR